MAQGFSSSTHMIAHNYLLLQFQGIGYPFLAFMAHMVYTMQVNAHYIKLNYRKKWCHTLFIPSLMSQRQVELFKL